MAVPLIPDLHESSNLSRFCVDSHPQIGLELELHLLNISQITDYRLNALACRTGYQNYV